MTAEEDDEDPRHVLLLGDAQSHHTRSIARSLVRRGMLVETVSGRPAPPGYDGRVHVIQSDSNAMFIVKATRLVRRLLRSSNYDVVNAHYATRYGLLGRLGAGRTPLVVSVWGSDVQSAAARRPDVQLLLRWVLSGATVVGATSRALAESARPLAAGRPVIVTHFGVDVERFHPTVEPLAGFTVVSLRGYAPNYGYRTLVEAFRSVVDAVPGARLVLGGGGDRTAVAELVRDLGLGDHVSLQGRIHRDDVPALIASGHVAAIPSARYEGFGVFAVEAAACARPVVASRVGGLVEIVRHNETGILVTPESSRDLAAALIELAHDPGRRRALGSAARRTAEELFAADRTIADLVAAYRLAMSVPPSRRSWLRRIAARTAFTGRNRR